MLYLIPLFLLAAFLAAYKFNRTLIITGFLFSFSIVSFIGIFFLQAYSGSSQILRIISLIPILLFILFLSFGVYGFIGFLILNTRSVLKKEKRSLKHFLALIFAAALLLIVIVPRLIDLSGFPEFAVYIGYSAYGLIICYLIHLTQFVISIILCNLSRPPKNQDYIIVLGCRVKDGKPTPMLARRIDRAVKFYNRQKEAGEPPKLVMSGGRGADEICAEAEAMKFYALKKGIPENHILTEPLSTSTFENMKFSKDIMDAESGVKPYKCIYITNNYHVLRAGIYARRAGLNINGIGAKTAFYYLPNAILREYIAYLYIHLKFNIAFAVIGLVSGSIIIKQVSDWITTL
ncbi:MAG: YdcF family protein [Oscillospiraceae bacterium]|nr:YdcF family protein [Oscillospiraceae bacterium]